MSQDDSRPHFNLVDEPWIMVRNASGDLAEVSLDGVFEQAGHLLSLAGETSQQDFAILRVLLAVLQRSLSDDIDSLDDDVTPSDVWGEMWESKELPLDQVRAYLDAWRGRFDLFDERLPFMQVADLETTNGSMADARKLLSISENKGTLTQMRMGERQTGLTYAEAARWLITAQAFDVGGAKSGARGDKQLKGGRGYPGGPSWAGRLGCLYAEGSNLAETLMLNLVLCADDTSPIEEKWFLDEDVPTWEQKARPTVIEERLPLGRIDLYTWQARRVRMVPVGGRVEEVVLTCGDAIDTVSKQGKEWMSAWCRNKKVEKQRGTAPEYLPVKHRPSRAMWRGLDSILPSTSSDASDGYIAPGVVRWLGYLSTPNGGSHITTTTSIRLKAVGYEYGTQSSVISESIDDELDVHVFLLSEAGARHAASARKAMASTENAIKELGTFAAQIVQAGGFRPADSKGGKKDPSTCAREAAEAEAYFVIDGDYRQWLADLDADSDLAACEQIWAETVERRVWQVARNILFQIDPSAVVGREVNGRWVTAASAEATLRYKVRRALKDLQSVSGDADGKES